MRNIYSKIKLSRTFATLINKELENIDNLKLAAVGKKPPTANFINLSKNISPSRNHRDSAGYFSALTFIRNNFQSLEFTVALANQLHRSIFQNVTKDQELVGVFKTEENSIKHVFNNGHVYQNHCTTPPEYCYEAIDKLFTWVTNHIEKRTIHPLILAALFKFQFVSIHPYCDGNGKISRLLTSMIMLKNGYKVFEEINLDDILEPLNDEYIKTLLCCQFYMPGRIVEIEYWLLFFLSVVSKSYFCHRYLSEFVI